MKVFIEHDESGLLYQEEDRWVQNPNEALAFRTKEDADAFREMRRIEVAHAVFRLDPGLIARLSSRVPGIYQSGE
ncbi:MAG TPA: hypothetical protein VGF13_21075 [Verrucomicrobiae bacterium]|jgi:hypothetical protein